MSAIRRSHAYRSRARRLASSHSARSRRSLRRRSIADANSLNADGIFSSSDDVAVSLALLRQATSPSVLMEICSRPVPMNSRTRHASQRGSSGSAPTLEAGLRGAFGAHTSCTCRKYVTPSSVAHTICAHVASSRCSRSRSPSSGGGTANPRSSADVPMSLMIAAARCTCCSLTYWLSRSSLNRSTHASMAVSCVIVPPCLLSCILAYRGERRAHPTRDVAPQHGTCDGPPPPSSATT